MSQPAESVEKVHPLYDLGGRVALVTGGGGAIGGASCMALARAGADVVVVDLRQEPAEARADAVRGLDRRSLVLVGDCADDAVVQRLARQALEAFGHVDVLVNVAGRAEPRWFWELQRPDFDRVLADNLGSAWSWARALMDDMRAGGWGRIINIASISAKHGGGPPATVSKSAYAASKAGVLGLTRGLAKELAPEITVNAICPGLIQTRGTRSLTEGPQMESILPTIPKRRLGQPDDVAAAVLFFASPGADWITGECMDVNGGQYID
jgi:3-oxoacyl-[acyl-carrier protein] reductase